MENLVILIGNIGNKPEVREVNDKKVVKFSLATNKTYRKGDEKITETQWHNIIAWSTLAEVVEKYTDKGSKLYIAGELRYRDYENKEKQKVYVTEIIARRLQLLDSKPAEKKQDEQEKEEDPFGDVPMPTKDDEQF